jgi:hypothetical protein
MPVKGRLRWALTSQLTVRLRPSLALGLRIGYRQVTLRSSRQAMTIAVFVVAHMCFPEL